MRVRLAAATLGAAAMMTTSVRAQEIGDPKAGRAYAEENCAECHAIAPGDYDSPNMGAPGFVEIANVPGMSEVALFSFFQTPHPMMPNFIVETADIRDLIAYIRSLKR